MVFEWSSALSVDVPSIDEQHKNLITLMYQLDGSVTAGRERGFVGTELEDLVSVATSHFRYEEGLMQQTGFGDFAEHQRQHDELMKTVNEVRERFSSGQIALSIEVMNFLKRWLVQHIQGADTKLGSHLSTQKAA